MFLGYGGDKKFIIKGYVDASFDTDLDASMSRSRYILKVELSVGAVLNKASWWDLCVKRNT